MAISYQTFADSPCAIVRAAVGTQPDGVTRQLRVGLPGAPGPTGQVGTIDNKVFFEKIVEAAMRLTGAASKEALSNAVIANAFLLAVAPNVHFQTQLDIAFPGGLLLPRPLIEQANAVVSASDPPFQPQWGAIQFENTGGLTPPRYVDFLFIVYPDGADPADTDSNILMVKLFHTVTT